MVNFFMDFCLGSEFEVYYLGFCLFIWRFEKLEFNFKVGLFYMEVWMCVFF